MNPEWRAVFVAAFFLVLSLPAIAGIVSIAVCVWEAVRTAEKISRHEDEE